MAGQEGLTPDENRPLTVRAKKLLKKRKRQLNLITVYMEENYTPSGSQIRERIPVVDSLNY